MHDMKSIFSLRRQKPEPYLTQVFAYILKRHRDYRNAILKECFNLTNMDENVNIIPEETTEEGRPDITICCKETSIAIEIKIDAGFTPQQLQKYKDEYDQVFLIYSYLSEPDQLKYADKSFTWFEIYSFTKSFLDRIKNDPVGKFLIEEFKKYLEEINMSIEKVDQIIIPGSKSLFKIRCPNLL